MLSQGKNCFQAEIDAACEFADFLRFNAYYAQEIHAQQPESADGIWNRLEYRPLEGFVFAITPFNFTAISGNLPAVAALMGNVVVWKPSDTQVYSAQVIMEIFQEAGSPRWRHQHGDMRRPCRRRRGVQAPRVCRIALHGFHRSVPSLVEDHR